MVLQPLWAGYLRAVKDALHAAKPTAYGYHSTRQAQALTSATEMLTAFAAVIQSRRQARSRQTKHERALFERLCVLSDQVAHSLRDIEKAASVAPLAVGHGFNTWSISNHIEAALLDLPKLDQMTGLAAILGHDRCLTALIRDSR